ncbi:MAG: hypothetical protein ACSHX8_15750 [Opitutaceae bacterium]
MNRNRYYLCVIWGLVFITSGCDLGKFQETQLVRFLSGTRSATIGNVNSTLKNFVSLLIATKDDPTNLKILSSENGLAIQFERPALTVEDIINMASALPLDGDVIFNEDKLSMTYRYTLVGLPDESELLSKYAYDVSFEFNKIEGEYWLEQTIIDGPCLDGIDFEKLATDSLPNATFNKFNKEFVVRDVPVISAFGLDGMIRSQVAPFDFDDDGEFRYGFNGQSNPDHQVDVEIVEWKGKVRRIIISYQVFKITLGPISKELKLKIIPGSEQMFKVKTELIARWREQVANAL